MSHSSEPFGANRLLEDLVVVELGDRVAVGACGGLLASVGAKVILVEPRVREKWHKWHQRPAIAAGKLSIALDPSSRKDQEVLRSIVDAADIVLLSSDVTPWNADVLSYPRPDQIVCDVTAFGRTGPMAGTPYSEALLQAASGVADTTGHRGGPPAVTGAPFLEMETAVYSMAAILAALHARRKLGSGQTIDMAIYDVAVNALLTFIPLHLVGRPATRSGNRHPVSVPWNSYRASDGWVLICGPNNDQWRRLCEVMGTPELVEDRRFATSTGRLENVDALDDVIGGWVAGHTVAQSVEKIAAQGIPTSSLIGISDLVGEPNLRKREQVLRVTDPDTEVDVLVPGSPIRVTGQPDVQPPAIPAHDQDRAAVLALASSRPRSLPSPVIRKGGAQSLEGIRVIEIGMNTVAPLASRQLGALGADVIKVEPPRGDTTRHNAPLRADGQAYLFALSNTDKRGIVLDLTQPSDLATLWKLLSTADIVVENLKPGSLAKLGVGPQDVLRRFPGMIYCSINGFGFHTAYPGRPALDTVIQAMSGAMSATVLDGVPTKAGISISDQLGGQFGLAAVLAALECRERTGKGMHLDLAMQDCSAWATQMIWNGRAGSSVKMLKCADGFIAVEGDLESPQETSELTREEMATRLGQGAAPILTVGEVLDHPQTKARELLKIVPTTDGSEWLVLGPPFKLPATPAKVRSAMSRMDFVDPDLAEELQPASASKASRAAIPTVGA